MAWFRSFGSTNIWSHPSVFGTATIGCQFCHGSQNFFLNQLVHMYFSQSMLYRSALWVKSVVLPFQTTELRDQTPWGISRLVPLLSWVHPSYSPRRLLSSQCLACSVSRYVPMHTFLPSNGRIFGVSTIHQSSRHR